MTTTNVTNAHRKGLASSARPRGSRARPGRRPGGPHRSPGPLDLTGEIDGAPFRIIVPATWNGRLLVLAHGYDDKADHPGEIDVRGAFPRQFLVARPALLAEGWAVAGTAYKDNGWVVKDALEDVVALTSSSKTTFAQAAAHVPLGLFDGRGGDARACRAKRWRLRRLHRLLLARRRDSAFRRLRAHDHARLRHRVRRARMPWGTPGDARDDIDFESEVLPVLLGQLFNPVNFGKFEFIRLLAGTPGRGLTPPLPPGLFPDWAFEHLFSATEGAAELERRAGGPAHAEPDARVHAPTAAESAYLASLGVDSGPLLAAMNGRRNISAPPSSRNYVEHYAEFDGTIKKPVLNLHNEIDRLVPVSHESAYKETVEAAGNSDLLFQAYTTAVGHCEFSSTQLVTTAKVLDAWVATGARPTNADFPAGQGFDQSFVPPAWLQSSCQVNARGPASAGLRGCPGI